MPPMEGGSSRNAGIHTSSKQGSNMACCQTLTLGAVRNANSTTISNHVHKAGNFKFFCSFLIFILKREIEGKNRFWGDIIQNPLFSWYFINQSYLKWHYYRGLHPRGCFQSPSFVFPGQIPECKSWNLPQKFPRSSHVVQGATVYRYFL